jgi:hypothetical protein
VPGLLCQQALVLAAKVGHFALNRYTFTGAKGDT